MSISQLSVRRPVLMSVVALVILLLGFFGASNLGVREYPNVDYPLIQVRTSYPGANAAVVEAEVTEILEASINSASGIKALTSTSRDGFSFINIEFETGMDLEAAANEVRDRVSRVRRRLPDDVDEPTVYKSDSDNDPILMLSLVSDKLDPMEVSEIANNQVKERLQTISGVSEVAIWGEKRPTVRLWIDPVRLLRQLVDDSGTLSSQVGTLHSQLDGRFLLTFCTEVGAESINLLLALIVHHIPQRKVIRILEVEMVGVRRILVHSIWSCSKLIVGT